MAVQSFSGECAGLDGVDWKALKSTVSDPFRAWDVGAKELEKTSLGKLVTAPVRIATGAVDASTGTLKAIPKAVNTVPLVLLILAGGIAAYLVFAGKAGTKLTPM
jgi:hypothetical protein